ncbi:MAG: hypothetical protein R3B53_02060 [Candidatus Paceibacterota bacterium]
MLSAGALFFTSLGLLLLFAFFTSWEQQKGARVLLPRLREMLDTLILKVYEYLKSKVKYLVRHTIKLSWYYSIHSMLKTIMTLLVKAYDRLELVFMENRERAKVLRAEKRLMTKDNHLTAMVEHKASTALTDSQKKKLKAKKLERE